VRGNAEVKAFAETDVMPGVMKLGFEVDQIDVHLHGHLQTKEGLPKRTALLKSFMFYLVIIYPRRTVAITVKGNRISYITVKAFCSLCFLGIS
jgi:hypothetical protein